MKTKLLKVIMGLMIATISPFIILAVLGLFYVLFSIVGGVSFIAAIENFTSFVFSFRPIFPYLTAIPVMIVLIMLFIKNREKILSLFKMNLDDKS